MAASIVVYMANVIVFVRKLDNNPGSVLSFACIFSATDPTSPAKVSVECISCICVSSVDNTTPSPVQHRVSAAIIAHAHEYTVIDILIYALMHTNMLRMQTVVRVLSFKTEEMYHQAPTAPRNGRTVRV